MTLHYSRIIELAYQLFNFCRVVNETFHRIHKLLLQRISPDTLIIEKREVFGHFLPCIRVIVQPYTANFAEII